MIGTTVSHQYQGFTDSVMGKPESAKSPIPRSDLTRCAWKIGAKPNYIAFHFIAHGEEKTPMPKTRETGENLNPKTQMTHAEMKQFVRDHFEEFINRKNLDIAEINFAPEFVEHGTDLPPGCPPGRAGTKQYVAGSFKKFPDLHVEILDMIAEGDRVAVHNHWTGTEAASGVKYELSGIVIWRIAQRQFVERWAYLSPPRPVG